MKGAAALSTWLTTAKATAGPPVAQSDEASAGIFYLSRPRVNWQTQST